MHRGYTKSWRKELDSDVWKLPPLYHRVWFWIRSKCNHETTCIPTTRRYGIWLLAGQKLTSNQQIAQGVSWVENGTEHTPHKQTICRILTWLEHNNMLTVTAGNQGTLISITNFDTYNESKPSPVTDDVPPMRRTVYTEKNVIEVKTLKDSYASSSTKHVSRIPSGDHQTFIAWWCFAYELTQGKPYHITGKDFKLVKELLGTYNLKQLIHMCCWLLTTQDAWFLRKRSIGSLVNNDNNLPGPKDPAHNNAAYRTAGIIPPEGIMFENWRFWEQNEPQEALAL